MAMMTSEVLTNAHCMILVEVAGSSDQLDFLGL